MRYRDIMVPRSLVPEDVRPVAETDGAPPAKRLYSLMDERIVVPAGLGVKPLDGRTNIPSHVPLDVLSPRLLIPRDMPIKPFTEIGEFPDYIPLDVLDSRVVVPRDVEPAPPPEQLLSRRDESAPIPPELRDVARARCPDHRRSYFSPGGDEQAPRSLAAHCARTFHCIPYRPRLSDYLDAETIRD